MFSVRGATSLAGQSALVTGGSRGLGLCLAQELAGRGCRVAIAARDAEELEEAAALLSRRTGSKITAVVCDVRDRSSVRAMLAHTADEHDGLDIVVANAGIIQVAPVDAIGTDEFKDAMSTIFEGALHTALEARPYLHDSAHGGRLAIIGSVGGLLAVPHLLPYSCAKSAVGALAEGLRIEEARHGVAVTAVHPGLMRTGSHLHAQFGGDREREFAWFSALAGTPLVSMDAQRAARLIVNAIQRRRPRVVLTPAARAASLAHGIAPATVTRLSTVIARALPTTDRTPGDVALADGKDVSPPRNGLGARLRSWGSALNDRAANTLNQRTSARGPSADRNR
jgi:NAD(P)-dependent dehydrogenase (short-subunit alcohol dehydrogenase family)